MMLVSIEPARALSVDLHMFQCAVCNHALTTFAALEIPCSPRAGAGFKAIYTHRSNPPVLRLASYVPGELIPLPLSGLIPELPILQKSKIERP